METAISSMTKIQLLEKCKELGITKCSSKNKSQLVDLIYSKQKYRQLRENKYHK